MLHDVASRPDRLRVALTVDRPDRPVQQVTRLRALAADPAVALVRVTPLVHQYALNDKLYYPVYATCAELGLPVSINVGIPGPRVRSACQHPELLEDVLIDFRGLTVIGAHMGHPYEGLLMQYMLKWPDLYPSNSAYLAKYMDPALVSFRDSKRGMGRVLSTRRTTPSCRWTGPWPLHGICPSPTRRPEPSSGARRPVCSTSAELGAAPTACTRRRAARVRCDRGPRPYRRLVERIVA